MLHRVLSALQDFLPEFEFFEFEPQQGPMAATLATARFASVLAHDAQLPQPMYETYILTRQIQISSCCAMIALQLVAPGARNSGNYAKRCMPSSTYW
jgi:hypothetical protein